jgi:iron complex transport system ATP-binding protein
MKEGRIVAEGSPYEVVTAQRLQDVFGLDAHVVEDPVAGRPHVIPRGVLAGGPAV